MKISVLMFGWEFPPFNSGGLGVACLGLTKSLVSLGTQITFVLPKRMDLKNNFLKFIFANDSDINFIEVNSTLSPYLTSESYNLKNGEKHKSLYGLTLIDEVKRYAKLAREIAQKESFDIIHAHDWLSFGAGIEAKSVSYKPLVSHVHATEFDRTGNGQINQTVYELERQGMEKSDKVIAVSNFTKNIIQRNYSIDPGKINVIHNGIEASYFSHLSPHTNLDISKLKKAGFKIVLFVGRITLQKGPDYFLYAAKKVLQYNPKVIFIIAGSGDMQHQMINLAANLNISDKVLFTGFLRGQELNNLYYSSDLFILPSVSEPFGIAPLESIISGTPALISKQSGVSEVLNHVLKVDFWDTDEMANKILIFLKNSPLQETLTRNSLNEVTKVNWQTAAQKCLDLYRSLI